METESWPHPARQPPGGALSVTQLPRLRGPKSREQDERLDCPAEERVRRKGARLKWEDLGGFEPCLPLPFIQSMSHPTLITQCKILSCGGLAAKSCLTLTTPWTVACQAPLSMGFSRQAYWSGLPCPSPGDLPNPGIETGSSALQADSLPTEL